MHNETILNDALLNRGTAFNRKERQALGIEGLIPYHVSTIEEQVARRYKNFCEQTSDLAKYVFLSALQNRNEVLFYRLVSEHISEMLPLIYTPTVGAVSQSFSQIYAEHRGVYFSYPLRDQIEEIIDNIPKEHVDVIVVTDGERILGLGDLGVGGMAIPMGKLSLYTLFGGIHPATTLPILLDVGTNNEELLNDPLYIGWRHRRITGQEYDAFVDRFVQAIKRRYPGVLLQWEDFAKPHAYPLLERYRKKICSFNDDVQGTAAVLVSALLSAVKASGGHFKDQRIVLFGAGSAGLGICSFLVKMMQKEGMSETQARECFYLVDRFGLIHEDLAEAEDAQRLFARSRAEVSKWNVKHPTLLDVVKHACPTILIGVSAQAGAFSQEVITTMAHAVKRPIIFPLSNPNDKAEADPESIMRWTRGQAIIATGSPFAPVIYDGVRMPIPQCNNVYIYPGMGLGIIASQAKEVSDEMILEAAHELSKHSPLLKSKDGGLFPSFEDLRSVSRKIAIAVAKTAIHQGLSPFTAAEIETRVDQTIWFPQY
jgi:malate dehydrogenase (oxaloacetate-decarboxylating)